MPWIHGDWIDDDESLAKPPSRWPFDAYLREVFGQAGWQPLPPPAPSAAGDAVAYARALLEEFGGLKLIEFNGGRGDPVHEIVFLNEPIPVWESEVRRSPFLSGSMVIASVSRGYAVLMVDGGGGLYLTDDVCHGLYRLGDDFAAAANLLVHNLPWPSNIRG